MTRQLKFDSQISDEERQDAEHQLLEHQRSVDFDTKEFTVELLVDKHSRGELYRPSYQRKFVWDKKKQSRFIESVLLA